jgi:hypothetical protein
MKPTFEQMMRLLLLLSGIAFFGVGVWMIRAGIKAEGSIDIRSEMLSGSIKTGSAGLFLTFFSFFMIVASVLFSRRPAVVRPRSDKSPLRVLLRILFSLYGLTIASYLFTRSRPDINGEAIIFGFVTAGLAVLSVIFSAYTMSVWEDGVGAKDKDTPKPDKR